MKASIVIPTYNRANFIEKALTSALSQDYDDLEIIISDDCSSDNTADIVKKYHYDKRVKYHRNTVNKGQMGNYLFAVKALAKGDWVFILCDDDYFDSPHYISTILQGVKGEDIDLVLTNTQIDLGDLTTVCHSNIHKNFPLQNYRTDELLAIWKKHPEVLDSATCFKRSIFFNGFGEQSDSEAMRLVEDFDLKILEKKVLYCCEVSYVFSIGEHSLNKFKVDIYDFIIILKSFVKPIKYSIEKSILTKQELKEIYLNKWDYYCQCTAFVSSVLDNDILEFINDMIDDIDNKSIFKQIEEKAKEYSLKYQKDIDKNILEFSKLAHIYENKTAKLKKAKSAIIYGTKIRAMEMQKFLSSHNINLICFIDDFVNVEKINDVDVYQSNTLETLEADIFIIATGNYKYISDIYATLVKYNIPKEKIIC